MNFPHNRLNQFISALFICLPVLLGCQLTNLLGNNSADPAPPVATVEILPTRGSSTSLDGSPPTAEPTEPAVSESPAPTSPSLPAADATEVVAPALPGAATDDIVFVSPAGYQLSHPISWLAVDYFGQTVVTQNPAILENGGALIDHPLLLIASGAANGQSAVTILNNVQLELLGDGALVPTSPVLPTTQGGANGMKSTQRLTLPEGTLSVNGLALIQGELYVAALGIIPENTADVEATHIENMLNSIILNTDQYNLDSAVYELSADQVAEMNQDLANLSPVPETSKLIGIGETQGVIKPAQTLAFEFTTDGVTPLNLSVIPNRAGFDLTLDLVDSLGNSILPAGKLLDTGRAGEAESINGLQLATGNYRLIVRGFGFTGGSFTIKLSN